MAHVIERLHSDHEKVERLFEKLQETGDRAEKTRSDLCQQLKNELQAHTKFEEEVFYPTVREHGSEAEKQVEAAIQEHKEVDEMLSRLEKMEPTSEEFLDLVSELQEAVEQHVQREEDKIFPLAKKGIEDAEAQEMAQRHDKMAREFMQQASR